MGRNTAEQDNRTLIAFWDQAFSLSEDEKAQILSQREEVKELAPSEKLFLAACSLGKGKSTGLWLRDRMGGHHCRKKRLS